MYPVVVPQIHVNPLVTAPPFYPGPHTFGGAPLLPVETPQHSFHNVFYYDKWTSVVFHPRGVESMNARKGNL